MVSANSRQAWPLLIGALLSVCVAGCIGGTRVTEQEAPFDILRALAVTSSGLESGPYEKGTTLKLRTRIENRSGQTVTYKRGELPMRLYANLKDTSGTFPDPFPEGWSWADPERLVYYPSSVVTIGYRVKLTPGESDTLRAVDVTLDLPRGRYRTKVCVEELRPIREPERRYEVAVCTSTGRIDIR